MVSALTASPRAEGLFHRAIAQSSSYMGLGIGTNPVGNIMILGDEVVAAETQLTPGAQFLEFYDTAYQQHLDGL